MPGRAAALVANGLSADEPKKPEAKLLTQKEFSKLMKDTHRGEKSPHARIVAELKKDSPDWEQLAKDVKAIEDFSQAFKRVRLDYVSPQEYLKSTAALSKSIGAKDKKASSEAFLGLTKTCARVTATAVPQTLGLDGDRLLK